MTSTRTIYSSPHKKQKSSFHCANATEDKDQNDIDQNGSGEGGGGGGLGEHCDQDEQRTKEANEEAQQEKTKDEYLIISLPPNTLTVSELEKNSFAASATTTTAIATSTAAVDGVVAQPPPIRLQECRLPSKKRKESHADSILGCTRKKSSSSMSDSVVENIDETTPQLSMVLSSPRNHSSQGDSSGASISHSLLLPGRKGSQDSSLKLPSLDGLLTLEGSNSFKTTSALHMDKDETPISATTVNVMKQQADSMEIGDQKIEAIQDNNHLDTSDIDHNPHPVGSALDHLEALHDTDEEHKKIEAATAVAIGADDETFASSGHRILMEAIMMNGGHGSEKSASTTARLDGRERLDSFPPGGRDRLDSFSCIYNRERLDSQVFQGSGRDRLESWGGMSDLSVPIGESSNIMAMAAAAAAASSLHQQQQHQPQHSLLADEITTAFPIHHGDYDQKTSAIPSKISLKRDRFNSIASIGEASIGDDEVTFFGNDLQAFVAAAMSSVGNQLTELAGAVEMAASSALSLGDDDSYEDDEDPIIGAAHDRRPRSWSVLSSGKISVDFDAVQAAVAAAEAASGTLGFVIDSKGGGQNSNSSCHPEMAPPPQKVTSLSVTPARGKSRVARRTLPLKRSLADSDSSGSSTDEESNTTSKNKRKSTTKSKAKKKSNQHIPLKKRGKRNSPNGNRLSVSAMPTPKVSNRSVAASDELEVVPSMILSSPALGNKNDTVNKLSRATEKWEGMFTAMLEYAQERRMEETKGMTEEETMRWEWDGHVPTNYKAKDGKALGRWVNNQRTAKTKGALKEDREHRLLEAGLRWSVVAGKNTWDEMLHELKIYIDEQTKTGNKWDGNVPSSYQIKARADGSNEEEDRNLGRWVNRQRSQFQAGKLLKERQLELEKLGLKWSMMVSTPWDEMYEALRHYATEQKAINLKGTWDGNVPANYRTKDDPPLALGRWVNRQRSAYSKKKLKNDYVEKLSSLGLIWSVYGRQDIGADNGEQLSGKENTEELAKASPQPEEHVMNMEVSKEASTEQTVGETAVI